MHGCGCTPKLTHILTMGWSWHPLQMSLCPSSHFLSSALQFDVQILYVFPIPSIPLLSAGQQWMSFQFLPRAVSCSDQLLDDRHVTCCHLHGLASPSCPLWTCFLCLCQKKEERIPPKTTCLQNHPHMAALGSKLLAIGLLLAFLRGGSRQKSRAVGGINSRILLFYSRRGTGHSSKEL